MRCEPPIEKQGTVGGESTTIPGRLGMHGGLWLHLVESVLVHMK